MIKNNTIYLAKITKLGLYQEPAELEAFTTLEKAEAFMRKCNMVKSRWGGWLMELNEDYSGSIHELTVG